MEEDEEKDAGGEDVDEKFRGVEREWRDGTALVVVFETVSFVGDRAGAGAGAGGSI